MLPRAFDITYAAMIPSRIGTGPLRDEAESSAMSALDDYQDQAFDYRCDDAGRWDDKPASAEHSRGRFDAMLSAARASQATSLDSSFRMIAGCLGLAELGIQPHPMEPKPLDADDMQRIGATLFAKIHARLKGEKVPSYPDGLAFYSMERAAQLVQGDFVSDSPFLNATEKFGRAGEIPTDEELAKAIAGGAKLWVVPIDIHN